MLRRGAVWCTWLIVAGVLGLSVWLFAPQMMAQYYIRRLASPDKAVADTAFERLKRMDKAAIPCLVDTVANGSPLISEVRHNRMTNFDQLKDEFESHFQSEPYLRLPGPDDRRMDLCAILLINHWDDGTLTDEHKQLILRFLFDMHLAASVERCSTAAESFRFGKLRRNVVVSVGSQFANIYWEHSLLVCSTSNEINKSPGKYSQTSYVKSIHEAKTVYEEQPDRDLAIRLEWTEWSPGELGTGKFELFDRVAVRATTKPDQDKESLKEYVLLFGPVRLEIVEENVGSRNDSDDESPD